MAVHRGYAGTLQQERTTVQLGYHSASCPPTFHFGVLDANEYVPAYLDTLSEKMRLALRSHVEERIRWPEVNRYHVNHQNFIDSEFVTK
jgi:hypothetical protein